MKRYSTSYVIRKLQISKVMRYRHIPIRMAKMPNPANAIRVRMCSKRGTPSLMVGIQYVTATLEDNLEVSYETKNIFYHIIQQSHSLAFTQKELKTYIHRKTCRWVLIAALIAKAGK